MEESAHFIASRNGHRSHVTRLFKKIDELINADEKQVCSLTTSLEQLKKKCELITQMNEKVLQLITESSDLEDAIIEHSKFNEAMLEKLSMLRQFYKDIVVNLISHRHITSATHLTAAYITRPASCCQHLWTC